MPASARVTQLQGLLDRITAANACLSSFDGWDRWGRSSSDEAQTRQMETEAASAQSDRTAAMTDLEALVAKLRTEEPAEIDAWADAHDALLASYITGDAANDPYAESAVRAATEARAEWAEVKAGKRTYSDQGSYAESRDKARYKELLGVDP